MHSESKGKSVSRCQRHLLSTFSSALILYDLLTHLLTLSLAHTLSLSDGLPLGDNYSSIVASSVLNLPSIFTCSLPTLPLFCVRTHAQYPLVAILDSKMARKQKQK